MIQSGPVVTHTPKIIVVSGTASNVGKTTLVCDLLRALPNWEAIKVTRGHYRSCGKQAESCCVGHLLGSQPIVHSDALQTRVPGKDTDRYWHAGASGVHWVIAKTEQVAEGVREAVSRVQTEGVIVETTSALSFLDPQMAVLVSPFPAGQVKPSARKALRDKSIDAIYFPFHLAGPESEPIIQEAANIPRFDESSKRRLLEMVLKCVQPLHS